MIDDIDKEFDKIIGNDNDGNEEQGPGEKDLEEIKNNIINEHQEEEKPASYEEWTTKLLEKRQNLEHIVKQNLPHLWLSIQLIISIKCILNIADCTLPVLMILLGAASSNKTVPIEMVMEEPNTYYTDSLSAKAFVSHSTAVKKKDLKEKEALSYLKDKGHSISAATYYRIKNEIEQTTRERLSLVASEEFLAQHLERIDMLKTIQNELWSNYHLEKNPTKRADILMEIAELQQYLSSFYDSTSYVMERAAIIKKRKKELEQQ